MVTQPVDMWLFQGEGCPAERNFGSHMTVMARMKSRLMFAGVVFPSYEPLVGAERALRDPIGIGERSQPVCFGCDFIDPQSLAEE